MDPIRLAELADAALQAAVRYDEEGVHAATQPILEEGTIFEGLAWVVGMIDVVTADTPRVPGMIAVPMVGRMNRETGQPERVEIDDAPPAMRAYARLTAAYIMDDREQAFAIWKTLADAPDRDQQIAHCMTIALNNAAMAVRRRRAQAQ